ncbi:MAG: bifunctional 3,4-dihydroxy-2-butanone-4-phosphate synthase/GTP cyclohydrolase II [Pseudomonadales bacterium]|jgi:3,4-dihydroxy 2-butanone 4-phosphate synthase/GTP cyclohydrolase II|nr:bifunctional 3,4-dihydroxy-2-butanone-4-phosphate synthase/GTP cyclohydrolase II [Pseudomonadales bacterium]
MTFSSVDTLIDEIRAGRMIVLLDDEDRENEGDLVMAAQHVTPEAVNFMAKHARGLICMPMTVDRARHLRLQPMATSNRSKHHTNFTVSIEAAEGVTTGISAADRARTIQVAVAPGASPDDLVTPGHVFPLVAEPGGVLSRAGHTEASCDLARLAGCEAAAVIVEIMNEDGTMARLPDLEKFAAEHGLKLGTIADLVHYRALHDSTVERIGEKAIETVHGAFRVVAFRDTLKGNVHLALVRGQVDDGAPTLVRVHAPNVLLDLVGAVREGPRSWSVDRALARVAEEGSGVVVILAGTEGPEDTLERFELFPDTPSFNRSLRADGSSVYHSVGLGSQILRDLGVRRMRLMSFPTRYNAISGFDLEIVEYITDDGERIPAEQVEGVTDLASRMRERDAGAR